MKVIDGDMLAIQLLLEAGMDPNTSDGGETVLNMAAKGHRPEVVKSPDSNGFCGHNRNPPIEEAIKKFCNQLG